MIGKETRLDRSDFHLPERPLARYLQDAEFGGYGPAQLDQAALYLLRSPNMLEFMEELVENELQVRIASQFHSGTVMFMETEQTDDAEQGGRMIK